MSAVLDTHGEPLRGETHGHHGPHRGIMRWITTTNHKDIGTMYLVFAGIMFFVGGMMALVIRSELFEPGMQIVQPEFFDQ
ncbi:MAG TPA: cytochrome c oxidase subunit I, partial [Burkholderiales bacterium]|nr:cytochrome c oxidase subunit I [Burkholderiales bacterium]